MEELTEETREALKEEGRKEEQERQEIDRSLERLWEETFRIRDELGQQVQELRRICERAEVLAMLAMDELVEFEEETPKEKPEARKESEERTEITSEKKSESKAEKSRRRRVF